MTTSQLVAPKRREALGAFVAAQSWSLVVGGAMLGWSLALFGIVRSDYHNFRLAKFDLGNMVQAVWSTAHGRPLEITMVTGEQGTRLASHVDPILVLLAPLWIVAPTPLTLAAAQIAAVSLGALPVFWLARRHLNSERTAALVALAYLASPWVAWNALEVFHPVALAIPLFLFSVWFLDGDRLWLFAACAVPAVLTGELMGLTIAALGIWYALARGRRAGYAVAALGTLWTLIAIYIVVPGFSGGSSVFYGYYGHVGGSPFGVIRTAVTEPSTILSALTTGNDVRYVIALTLPLAGMFVLAPGLAAVALPQLLANGLSYSPIATSPGHHYSAAVIPFLVAATIFGLARLAPNRQVSIATLILGTSLGFALVFGAWPGAPGEIRLIHTDVTPAKVEALRAALELVPAEAPVTATNRVGAHLSARRQIFTVPVVARSDWIVLDSSDAYIPGIVVGRENPELLRTFLRRIETSTKWEKLLDRNGVFVFRRVSNDEGTA
ncbi:MAG: hypothetical protein HW413_537 [Thermoleophilia bacterium]|nr:hypothetical protein [Thermoleophilia bacterium]